MICLHTVAQKTSLHKSECLAQVEWLLVQWFVYYFNMGLVTPLPPLPNCVVAAMLSSYDSAFLSVVITFWPVVIVLCVQAMNHRVQLKIQENRHYVCLYYRYDCVCTCSTLISLGL